MKYETLIDAVGLVADTHKETQNLKKELKNKDLEEEERFEKLGTVGNFDTDIFKSIGFKIFLSILVVALLVWSSKYIFKEVAKSVNAFKDLQEAVKR